LDDCADLVWESLLEPEKEKLPKEQGVYAYMTYEGEVSSGTIPGREYSITLGSTRAVANFFVADERIYVLTVLNAARGDEGAQRFLKSFVIREGVKTNPPPSRDDRTSVGPAMGSDNNEPNGVVGAGAATDNSTDYNRTFTAREVTQRARLLSKPQPSYTESARKYSVQGTVIISAVISKTGQIVNAKVVKGLPHGLTASALGAARLIKSSPAVKDGHAVAQYIQIEYNFNLY
jgi:TonB family protein